MASRENRYPSPEPNIDQVRRSNSGNVLGQRRSTRQTRKSRATSSPPREVQEGSLRDSRTITPGVYKNMIDRINDHAFVRNSILNGFNKPRSQGRYYGITEFSYFRDGLISINYSTNVRDFGRDIRRQQGNRVKQLRKQGEDLEPVTKYQYSVYNSDVNFDVNSQLTIDEILLVLRVDDLRNILRTFNIIPSVNERKSMLIQQIKTAIGSANRNNRESYVRNYYRNNQTELRIGRQTQRQNPNETLLVSNHIRYSKKHFEGMSQKHILQTLFDLNDHVTFLYNKVLKEKRLPESREELIERAFTEIRRQIIESLIATPLRKTDSQSQVQYIQALSKYYLEVAEPIIEKYCDPRSNDADRIQKENAKIVLDVLFAPKKQFFIGPRPYSILNYVNETPIPSNDVELQEEFDMGRRDGVYIEYPTLVHLTLSDKAPDKITEKDLQHSKCHNQWQKVKKNWHQITTKTNQGFTEDVFERKFHKPLNAPIVGLQNGGKKKTKHRRYIKNKTRRRK